MTKAELMAETIRRLEETTPSVFHTDDEIDVALNVAYAELSDQTEWNEQSITVDRLAGRPWYDGRTVIGDQLLTIGRAFNPQTNRWLTPTPITDLDAGDRRWERVTTESQRLLVRGLWWFAYWPYSVEDTGTITQYYTALPDDLDADTDEPGFPEQFHLGIVEGALAELWADDAETTAAMTAWQAYLQYETNLGQWVQQRAAVPYVRGLR